MNAVRGLGERLVSGQASPDDWRIREGHAVCLSAPEGASDVAQARSIADMAKRAERLMGGPQDIEWAISGNQLYLLQSRPITARSARDNDQAAIPVKVPPGFWQRDSVHYAQPISPLIRTTYLPAQSEGLTDMCQALALPFAGMDYREIVGWVYQRIVALGGKDSNPPPDWLMSLLVRLVPVLRAREKGMVRNIRNDIANTFFDQGHDETA